MLAVKIAVIESERGWGQRLDDYMVCLSVKDALKFKEEFNAQNNKPTVPDWYMVCTGDPIPIDITMEQYNTLVEEEDKRAWATTLGIAK